MSVKVAQHPETGAVITPSTKNPEWGTIRVDSEHVSFEKGIVNINKRSAFIRGKLEDLGKLNLTAGKTLPGQILKRESFDPFYEGQSPKIYPDGSEFAGQPVLTNGRETYLEYVYTADMSASDTWVGTDSAVASEEVQNALAEQATV